MLQEDMRRRLYVSAMQRGAAVYAVLLLPLGYVMPSYLAWENGLLEMLQNIVLFGNMCLAAYFYFTYTLAKLLLAQRARQESPCTVPVKG